MLCFVPAVGYGLLVRPRTTLIAVTAVDCEKLGIQQGIPVIRRSENRVVFLQAPFGEAMCSSNQLRVTDFASREVHVAVAADIVAITPDTFPTGKVQREAEDNTYTYHRQIDGDHWTKTTYVVEQQSGEEWCLRLQRIEKWSRRDAVQASIPYVATTAVLTATGVVLLLVLVARSKRTGSSPVK